MFQIDLSGKTALITGSNSGIGLGIARQMALAGANISGCARTLKKDLNDEMRQYKGKYIFTECDVTKPEDMEKTVKRTVDEFGGVDILISNAGQNIFTGAEQSAESDWKYNMDLNLTSHWRLSKLCKPYLEKSNDGVIILMTSNHAFASIPGCFPYNVTKTAITGLVRSLTIEWGPKIRIVGIAPGFIDTEINVKWFNTFPDPAAERKRTIEMHPSGRIGTSDEIGALCVFLVSPMAGFINGTTILVDGGRSALMQDDPVFRYES